MFEIIPIVPYMLYVNENRKNFKKIVPYLNMNGGVLFKPGVKESLLPRRSTTNSVGYDFFSPVKITLKKDKMYQIPTFICCNLTNFKGPNNVVTDPYKFLAIYPRSSYGFKYGMRLNNTVGIIDSDYYANKDNYGHIILSVSVEKELEIEIGDKIAQGVIQQAFIFNDEIHTDSTRNGGIGSTGK